MSSLDEHRSEWLGSQHFRSWCYFQHKPGYCNVIHRLPPAVEAPWSDDVTADGLQKQKPAGSASSPDWRRVVGWRWVSQPFYYYQYLEL